MSRMGVLQSPPPDVAIEIGVSQVAAVRLTWRGAAATVAGYTAEPLGAGAVIPALAAPNIADVAVVGRAIVQALGRLGGRPRRAALVVPDTIAKVSLVRFEKIPPKAADLLELVRWQIRKSAPFPLEQAIVTFTPGIEPPEGGREFIVSVARRDIVEEYEGACAAAGVHAGLVDLATFSVINGVLASQRAPAGDWLLVHTTPAFTSLAVLRGADVIFFRHQAEDAEGALTDVVHQTAMYYEDRLKGAGFTRVLLAGGAVAPGGTDALRRNLEERLRVQVESVDPRIAAGLVDRIGASPDMLDALAPLVGILVRERKAA